MPAARLRLYEPVSVGWVFSCARQGRMGYGDFKLWLAVLGVGRSFAALLLA